MVNKHYSTVGFANGNAKVKLTESEGYTILNYEVDVSVGGKIAQLGSRLIDGVAKKMSEYFFGRFADLISPNSEKIISNDKDGSVEIKRVKEVKSNFLNKYIYSGLIILILLLVAIYYFL